jgi:hypothetical protein
MATADAAGAPAVSKNAATSIVVASLKAASAVWTVVLEEKFIGIWGEEFLRINQGNFRPHNWTFVHEQFNKELPKGEPAFTVLAMSNQIRQSEEEVHNRIEEEDKHWISQ